MVNCILKRTDKSAAKVRIELQVLHLDVGSP